MSINAVAPAGTQTGPFWVGDTGTSSVLELDQDGESVTGFTEAYLLLTDPEGEVTQVSGVSPLASSAVTITWPTGLLDSAGLWSVQVVLTAPGKVAHVGSVPFVVEDATQWHTLDTARREWTTGAPADSVILYSLLEAARASVEAYAPALAEDVRVPLSYRQAQVMQARNILNISKTDPSYGSDGEMFVIRPYPLDNAVKQLLRPKRVLGEVG